MGGQAFADGSEPLFEVLSKFGKVGGGLYQWALKWLRVKCAGDLQDLENRCVVFSLLFLCSHPIDDLNAGNNMNGSASRTRYETRLGRVLDHIYDHLDEPLDISRLADIACLSPYHWSGGSPA